MNEKIKLEYSNDFKENLNQHVREIYDNLKGQPLTWQEINKRANSDYEKLILLLSCYSMIENIRESGTFLEDWDLISTVIQVFRRDFLDDAPELKHVIGLFIKSFMPYYESFSLEETASYFVSSVREDRLLKIPIAKLNVDSEVGKKLEEIKNQKAKREKQLQEFRDQRDKLKTKKLKALSIKRKAREIQKRHPIRKRG